jgi:hypothetical protein
MTDFPRWERESQQDLRPLADQPEETAEYDLAAAGLVDPGELSEPPEYAHRVTETLTATRESLAGTAARVGRWFAALDRRPEFDAPDGHDPVAELTPGIPEAPVLAPPAGPSPLQTPEPALETEPEPEPEPSREPATAHFPTAALGYHRAAVDHHVAELEAELARLRASVGEPVSITEEIERLGEQTASILVVAHDKAHETARRAQAQAAQAVSDAAHDAERLTAEAERRLRELDEETDAVWQERARLLDDVRAVSATLAALAEDATERFPAAEPRSAAPA